MPPGRPARSGPAARRRRRGCRAASTPRGPAGWQGGQRHVAAQVRRPATGSRCHKAPSSQRRHSPMAWSAALAGSDDPVPLMMRTSSSPAAARRSAGVGSRASRRVHRASSCPSTSIACPDRWATRSSPDRVRNPTGMSAIDPSESSRCRATAGAGGRRGMISSCPGRPRTSSRLKPVIRNRASLISTSSSSPSRMTRMGLALRSRSARLECFMRLAPPIPLNLL